MRKQILFILFVFMSILTANGQDNTYFMTITMTNGTTISIGPNEIKNITFNDGQINVTGEQLETFMNNTAEIEKNLQGQIDGIRQNINDIVAYIQKGYFVTDIKQADEGLYIIFSDGNSYLVSTGKNYDNDIKILQGQIDNLKQNVQDIQNVLNSLSGMN